jgi:hypothetical protein
VAGFNFISVEDSVLQIGKVSLIINCKCCYNQAATFEQKSYDPVNY